MVRSALVVVPSHNFEHHLRCQRVIDINTQEFFLFLLHDIHTNFHFNLAKDFVRLSSVLCSQRTVG
jgi:hypothetical protein